MSAKKISLVRRSVRALRRRLIGVPATISPRSHQPAVEQPPGTTYEGLLSTLATFAIDSTEPGVLNGNHGELENYVRQDYERFLQTLSLVERGPMELLEIGANPYFMTYLLKKFRPDARLTLANSFGGPQEWRSQTLAVRNQDDSCELFDLPFFNANIESEPLPFEDASFDTVLYCEVIEHLTEDPVRALVELKRVLKPGGVMVLTTPNVARLENVARLVAGANLYDPYSGYGVYGRHNREYSRHELWRLMTFCGFSPKTLYTADVHVNHAASYSDLVPLTPLLEGRAADLGQYIFSSWINDGPVPKKVPGWLYRSIPAERIDPTPL